ncbi:hypothetical protein X798_06506 [Onchocerca flexuosa]|uniref:Uncharacterized protein n=1 Tax=Onchocerca flexuosa TaxID=387005 RepID=A0A238BN94_9BILA|nr:hypothetical protein X798_06506 [Onchocerca flexuosa]
MLKTKSDGESKKEGSKSISQNIEEKMIRKRLVNDFAHRDTPHISFLKSFLYYSMQLEEHMRNQSSNSSNINPSDHAQLKKQNIPRKWERFEKMIRKKKNINQHSTRPIIIEGFVTDKLSEKENWNEMEFDVTQWDNTLWTKKNKHLKFSPLREDNYKKKNNDEGLTINITSPFAKEEVLEEPFFEKIEKGNYLMKRTISVGVESLELIATLTATIILLFTIDYKCCKIVYPLCNTVFTSSIVILLILLYSFYLYLEKKRNNQDVIEYYIPTWKKYLLLHAHITRCIFSLISIAQTVYLSMNFSTHRMLFHLIIVMLIIHFCCAFIHLYFATKNRFVLSFKSNRSI